MSSRPSMDRQKRTLYITGFNSKLTTKNLLEELFTQVAPVQDVTLFHTHAYITLQDEESVPYCLAMLDDIELHGEKLRINPKIRTKNAFATRNHLAQVRNQLRQIYSQQTPPDLPAKQATSKSPKKNLNLNDKTKNKKKNKSDRKLDFKAKIRKSCHANQSSYDNARKSYRQKKNKRQRKN